MAENHQRAMHAMEERHVPVVVGVVVDMGLHAPWLTDDRGSIEGAKALIRSSIDVERGANEGQEFEPLGGDIGSHVRGLRSSGNEGKAERLPEFV